MPLAEFDLWVLQPENIDTEYEYICGEVVRREVSNGWAAMIGARLASWIALHVRQHRLGYSMAGRAGFRLGDERYVPIATYTEKSRWIEIEEVCYLPFAPTLALESISSLRHPKHLRRKIPTYLRHNTPVWVINADEEEIEVYNPDLSVCIYRHNESLQDNKTLPGLSIDLAALFER
jgi:Uma2 family endonuclease